MALASKTEPRVQSPSSSNVDYEHLETSEALKQLGADPQSGLSDAEAKTRLEKYGPNALPEKKVSAFEMFGKFFWGPMPWMIEAAAIMSLLVRDLVDFSIIMVMLFFNAVLGFWHERQAASALDALKGALAQEAQALRGGKGSIVLARTLVPGDVVRIRLGNVVPADVKLLEGLYLDVDQSALTGESLPVSKAPGDLAYSGSIAKKGEMTGAVIGTGANTFFGRTAGLVQSAGSESHFVRANNAIGDFLIILAVALAVVMVAVQLHRGDDFLRIAEYALLLLVAAIPVAMPAVLSMTMAMGAKALSVERAIVSRLDSIEELAGITILFSDKTGTLTQNKLTLGEPIVWGGARAEDVILAGALSSKKENDDPIDLAVLKSVKDPSVLDVYRPIAYMPFDPVSKRTEATFEDATGKQFKVSKGMPPVIFELAGLAGNDLAAAQKVVSQNAADGYRTLAVARCDEDGRWNMLGILPMFDPPREDSRETIARAAEYGVKVKMVTGDDVAIGKTIASQLGLGSNIIAASDIFTGEINQTEVPMDLARRVDVAEGYGRVFPEHKWAIVKSAQQLGHIVGMTGDGVNDAPALKQADVGVAVSGATEAARAAASLILTAPGLSVIIRGIEEARKTFERMMGYAYYRVAMTVSIMLFIVLVMVIFNAAILTPVMIILLALLDDVPVMLIAFDNAKISSRPTKWDMHRVLVVSSMLALIGVVQSIILVRYLHHEQYFELAPLQTAMFMQLVIAGHLLLFSTRTTGFFFQPPFPEWRFFSAIMGTQVLAACMAAFGWLVTPISWRLIGFIWLYNLVWLFVIDLLKLAMYRQFDRREAGRVAWKSWFHPLDPQGGRLAKIRTER
ncbi:H+-transporting ATPase [Mycoplana sp. BE70]|uniref:plasma-membrane proton-efflux P-type ATPase n=1 Tax=Mycoplana sp. BE70 TaxID=2817775 RepID=UPI0028546977|nr:plasma-membrane proton-efflux P-type ATPase [Mycoplana sp. BE70]MDR6758112.1 H+-transporting ATPase [Mycoplana sp. BE70]